MTPLEIAKHVVNNNRPCWEDEARTEIEFILAQEVIRLTVENNKLAYSEDRCALERDKAELETQHKSEALKYAEALIKASSVYGSKACKEWLEKYGEKK